MLVPAPVDANAAEPGVLETAPLLTASHAGDRVSLAYFRDASSDALEAVAETWQERVRVDFSDWSDDLGGGRSMRSASGALTGPGPAGFGTLHVFRFDGSDETWVQWCTTPNKDDHRCDEVAERVKLANQAVR